MRQQAIRITRLCEADTDDKLFDEPAVRKAQQKLMLLADRIGLSGKRLHTLECFHHSRARCRESRFKFSLANSQ